MLTSASPGPCSTRHPPPTCSTRSHRTRVRCQVCPLSRAARSPGFMAQPPAIPSLSLISFRTETGTRAACLLITHTWHATPRPDGFPRDESLLRLSQFWPTHRLSRTASPGHGSHSASLISEASARLCDVQGAKSLSRPSSVPGGPPWGSCSSGDRPHSAHAGPTFAQRGDTAEAG